MRQDLRLSGVSEKQLCCDCTVLLYCTIVLYYCTVLLYCTSFLILVELLSLELKKVNPDQNIYMLYITNMEITLAVNFILDRTKIHSIYPSPLLNKNYFFKN